EMLVRQLYNRLAVNQELYIFYSDKRTGVHFLPKSYREALHASQFKHMDERVLFDYAQLKERDLRTIMLPSETYKDLLHEIEGNDGVRIEQALGASLERFGHPRCAVEATQATLHSLVAACLSTARTMLIDRERLRQLRELIGWDSSYMSGTTRRALPLSFALD